MLAYSAKRSKAKFTSYSKVNEANRARAKEWVLDAWEHIDQGFIDGLIDSIPRRRTAVRSAYEWYTKYEALSRSYSFLVVALDLLVNLL